MLSPSEITRLCNGRCADPFAVLGLHRGSDGQAWVRAFLPGASAVTVIGATDDRPLGTLIPRHPDGVFEGPVALAGSTGGASGTANTGGTNAPATTDRPAYRLHITWADGQRQVSDDPYRFGPLLGEMDAWLLAEGTHLRPFEVLGANPQSLQGVAGTGFAVWAPNATRVSVVGDFNQWDGRRHPMRQIGRASCRERV